MHLTFAGAVSLGTAMIAAFMGLPLLTLARHRPASGWLAGLILAIGALSFCDSEVLRRQTFGLLDWPVAALGACYYCYVRSLTGLGNGRRQALHFMPALLAAGIFAGLHLSLAKVPAEASPSRAWLATFFAVVYASQAITLGYLGPVLWRLAQHRARVRECFSSTARRDLAWLAWLTGATLALFLAWVPATVLGGGFGEVLLIGRVLLLCFIGWYGVRQAPVFVPALAWPALASHQPVPDPAPTDSGRMAATDAPALPPKYARSGLTEAAGELIASRLAHRMSVTRDYLENELTLGQLAERIGTSPQWLSQYLNHVLGQSFFDYVNGLRVLEVQRALGDSANIGRPLLEIALAAGFNSKSTFNAAFKKHAGCAPSAWRAGMAAMTSEPIG